MSDGFPTTPIFDELVAKSQADGVVIDVPLVFTEPNQTDLADGENSGTYALQHQE